MTDSSDISEQTIPAPLIGAGVQGNLDLCGPEVIDGWITLRHNPSPPVEIEIREGGQVVASVTADVWRNDLAESRQGDGRWGFTALPPACLADGAEHVITLALRNGAALLAGPVRVRFTPGADSAALPQLRPPPFEPDPAGRTRPGPAPDVTGGGVLVSFIVVFYNMGREAARTLASLRRGYQRGVDQLAYEVICIDNGSAEPLDAAWVESFGPEFRLITAAPARRSPVGLMNEAARAARGHHLALMIDGAHLLTPGVLREAAEAIGEAPDAVIGLRHWFIGGDQRFLAHNGWTRAHEDMLFDRIAWPREGYDLFRIASPMWESPNNWFDGMSESNCLFVPSRVFAAIGGLDEAFDEPGGGYANLDLFRRAFEATGEPPIALLGEASFHQFHGGTTTNVRDDEKERLVRGYEYKYMRLRGKPWQPIDPGSIRLRGQVRTRSALGVRQRPLSPARIGVTDVVRQSNLATHLDEAARDYLASVYVETDLDQRAAWRGVPLGVAPADALEIAAILHQVRPSHIVAVHPPPGLVAFLGEAARGHGGSQFVIVGEGGIGGSDTAYPLTPATLRAVRHALGAATDIVVLLGNKAQTTDLLRVLCAYGEFVSLRSYMVVLGSARGQPWLGYSRVWPMKAINSFAAMRPFCVDRTRTAHLLTSCPLGFLQRIGPVTTGREDISEVLAEIGVREDGA